MYDRIHEVRRLVDRLQEARAHAGETVVERMARELAAKIHASLCALDGGSEGTEADADALFDAAEELGNERLARRAADMFAVLFDTHPGCQEYRYAWETGCSYEAALVACNMD